jgi:hypothetical protein
MPSVLLAAVLTLALVGASAAIQDALPPAAAATHEWCWIQVSPRADGWTTRDGRADVVIDGEAFEATLYDAQGEALHVLRGTTDGERFTGVVFHTPAGVSQRGKAPAFEGRRREFFPSTLGDAAYPPQRIWESITLTSLDTFVGLTHK